VERLLQELQQRQGGAAGRAQAGFLRLRRVGRLLRCVQRPAPAAAQTPGPAGRLRALGCVPIFLLLRSLSLVEAAA
jgi:hypothetical protein